MEPPPHRTSVRARKISPVAIWKRYVGIDADLADQGAVAAALCGGLLLGALTTHADVLSALILGVLGADLCGGLVAHLRGPIARQVRRTGRSPAGHAAWVTGHLLQYACFALILREAELARLAAVSAALLFGAITILRARPAIQRRVGLAATCVGLIFIDATVGLQQTASWFLPLLLAKVFIAYLPEPLPSDATRLPG